MLFHAVLLSTTALLLVNQTIGASVAQPRDVLVARTAPDPGVQTASPKASHG